MLCNILYALKPSFGSLDIDLDKHFFWAGWKALKDLSNIQTQSRFTITSFIFLLVSFSEVDMRPLVKSALDLSAKEAL